MITEVLIEPVASGGCRLTNRTLGITLEAGTRDDAIAQFRKQVEARLKNGAEIVSVHLAELQTEIELPPLEHPLARFAGFMREDPMFDEWRQAIQDYPRQVDEDELLKSSQRNEQ